MGRHHRHHHFKHHNYHNHSRFSIGRIFYKIRRFVRRSPIFSAVFAIVLGIILLRISYLDVLFGRNVTELRVWFMGVAILMGIIGIIALKVWFRNNVSDSNVKVNVNWKNK